MPLLKNTANILSISRIVLLPALFFTYGNALLFTAVYLACGLSDVLDGYIARKTKSESTLGAKLDSIADLGFFAVVMVSIIFKNGDEILEYLPWIAATVLIRMANLVIAAYKYHAFAILHTWGNKLAGFLLFATPLILHLDQTAWLLPVCFTAVLSAAEESIIHLTSTELDLNRASLFYKK